MGTVSLNVSDAPVIANLAGDNLVYTEGAGAVVIDQSTAAAVSDVDSSNFDTGTLTVAFTAGSDAAEDVLAIRNQGTGAGQIGVSGSTVTYAGTTIGTFTGGSAGTNLVITLNSNADATATSALVQNITYENTDTDNPTTTTRTVRYVLTDGDGSTSANYDTTVTVTAVNDAPVLTPATPSLTTITENDTSNGGDLVSAIVGTSITDVDTGDPEGIAITTLSGGNGTWQYNTGSGWTNIGAVSNASALLLRSTDSVRFVPDGLNSDSASITYHAWDQTSGSFGTKVSTVVNGGATAFSIATDTASITVTAVNDAPVITSNGGGPSANINMTENTTAVSTVTASDVDVPADTLTFSIVGGTDQGFFSLDSNSGALTFSATPDFETPLDSNTDNIYQVQVQVSDGNGGMDTQTINVTVVATNDAPIITSNGGGATANTTAVEQQTSVTTITATDADLPPNTLSYSLIGGGDIARFSINSSNGVLTFSVPPDVENPADANMDNVYEVQVLVSDGNGSADSQTNQVEVTNVVEAPPPPPEPPPEPPSEEPTPEENTPDSEQATESSSSSKIQGTSLDVNSATDSEEQEDKSKSKRSEERREGKECRSRWSPNH